MPWGRGHEFCAGVGRDPNAKSSRLTCSSIFDQPDTLKAWRGEGRRNEGDVCWVQKLFSVEELIHGIVIGISVPGSALAWPLAANSFY